MKKLFRTWKDSITILTSKELGIMIFATTKTVNRALKLMIKYFSWLLLTDALLHGYVLYSGVPFTPTYLGFAFPQQLFLGRPGILSDALRVGISLFSFLVVKNLLAFTTCLAVRPSLDRKDHSYFWNYLYSKDSSQFYLGAFVIFVFFVRLPFLYLFPLPWLCYFFLIDMSGTRWQIMLDAITNGIRFCVYFFPIVFFLFVLERGCDALLSLSLIALHSFHVSFYIVAALRFLGSYLAWVVLLSFTSSFYIKIKHTYYSMFFGPNNG